MVVKVVVVVVVVVVELVVVVVVDIATHSFHPAPVMFNCIIINTLRIQLNLRLVASVPSFIF